MTKILILFILCLVFFSCRDEDEDSVRVRISGAAFNTDATAFLASWTNASLAPLGEAQYSIKCGFTVGNDVYHAGSDIGRPVFWKNGEMTILPGIGFVSAMYVTNGDVYCLGSMAESENDGFDIVVWKNTTPTVLTSLPAHASSIFVSENDVYVVGDLRSRPVYWKNGVMVDIIDDMFLLGINIAISNSDVHVTFSKVNKFDETVGGFVQRSYHVKNGIVTELNHSNGVTGSITNSLFIDGDDVYVTGVQFGGPNVRMATYWKNGSPIIIEGGINAVSVAKSGDDIYVLGYIPDQKVVNGRPVYWKNSIATELESDNLRAFIEYQAFHIALF